MKHSLSKPHMSPWNIHSYKNTTSQSKQASSFCKKHIHLQFLKKKKILLVQVDDERLTTT